MVELFDDELPDEDLLLVREEFDCVVLLLSDLDFESDDSLASTYSSEELLDAEEPLEVVELMSPGVFKGRSLSLRLLATSGSNPTF